MPAEDFHEVEVLISDDLCDAYTYGSSSSTSRSIHICDQPYLHKDNHYCNHGGACGYSWPNIIEHQRVFKYLLNGAGLNITCSCGGFYSSRWPSLCSLEEDISVLSIRFREHLRESRASVQISRGDSITVNAPRL